MYLRKKIVVSHIPFFHILFLGMLSFSFLFFPSFRFLYQAQKCRQAYDEMLYQHCLVVCLTALLKLTSLLHALYGTYPELYSSHSSCLHHARHVQYVSYHHVYDQTLYAQSCELSLRASAQPCQPSLQS